jgi:predicted RecA/RadA family phage recombinase
VAPQATFYQEGDIIDYTNSGTAAISAGDIVALINRCGVAVVDIAVGATGGVAVEGIFTAPADSTVSYGYGDKLYYDAARKVLTNAAANNTPAGWAARAKATGDSVAYWGLDW